MPKVMVGTRLRERRRSLGITQVALAQKLDISPSYLNLIEHNKRGIAGSLLRRAAEALGLELDQLDGAAEYRLLEALEEIAYAPELQGIEVESESVDELIGRYPGWSRAIAALSRSEHEATEAARALADRLTHDPFLGETVHRMLTRIAAIRSAAEILKDFPDISVVDRDRFLSMIHDESRTLSSIGEALAAYFDKVEETDRNLTPLDEVDALFDARDNFFEEIEDAARNLGVISDSLPKPRYEKARVLAEEKLCDLIEGIVDGQPELETLTARNRARELLVNYAVAAILAPIDSFQPTAELLGYDIEALADSFSLDIETVCRRLTALPREDTVPQFGYLCANAAGTILEMRSLAGLVAPRYASACPLWVLYRAQQSPEAVIRQRALFPTGARFVFLARARNIGPTGFGKPRHYVTDMLVMSEADARKTIYAPGPMVPVEEVGPACRICPRKDCGHRVEDPFAG
ncbi:XRE family transcriptional regulator [Limibacillus halophilus]|uniref:HTH cro/C1-type domain-containing protein n=1 Tax=Limibacillus halophilus TaxID=1579333 RepID=A0A839SZ24_9PROT|nr:XRE family transcriptional regulator [Limibacillus halophilus]MBB3066173.1 hypothetical protein [Limibacillus halophilus]